MTYGTYPTNPGTGGLNFAQDTIGGAVFSRLKLEFGPEGTANSPSLATPMPVGSSQETAQVLAAGVVLTPKFAVISASASGNNQIVGAVTSKKIRVLALMINASGTVNGKFQSGSGGTDIMGFNYMVANTGAVLPHNPLGWFETAAGALLNLNLSAAIAVGGCLTYVEV